MNKKLPHILNFEDLWDQYSIADLYDPYNNFLWREKSGLKFDEFSESYENSTKGVGEKKTFRTQSRGCVLIDTQIRQDPQIHRPGGSK